MVFAVVRGSLPNSSNFGSLGKEQGTRKGSRVLEWVSAVGLESFLKNKCVQKKRSEVLRSLRERELIVVSRSSGL